jgi:hypothetical protein
VLLVLGLTAAPGLAAESPLAASASPGFVPQARFDAIPEGSASVMVDLSGAMLRLVAIASSAADPAFADLVGKLEAVRVRLVEVDRVPDAATLRAALRATAEALHDQGWQTSIRSRDEDSDVDILQREVEGRIVGLAVILFEDGDEAGLINLVGEIDPSELAILAEGLRIEALRGRDWAPPRSSEPERRPEP